MSRLLDAVGLVVLAALGVAMWRATAPPAPCPHCLTIHHPEEY